MLYTRSKTHYGGRNVSPTYQQGSRGTEQCPALQATTGCILPALQFNNLSVRLHRYSAVPQFNINPLRAHEFRDRQENSASPTLHLHHQTLSLPSLCLHTQRTILLSVCPGEGEMMAACRRTGNTEVILQTLCIMRMHFYCILLPPRSWVTAAVA